MLLPTVSGGAAGPHSRTHGGEGWGQRACVPRHRLAGLPSLVMGVLARCCVSPPLRERSQSQHGTITRPNKGDRVYHRRVSLWIGNTAATNLSKRWMDQIAAPHIPKWAAVSVMSSGKPHQSQPPADLVLCSGGLALTSCIMSRTVHRCPCVSDTRHVVGLVVAATACG